MKVAANPEQAGLKHLGSVFSFSRPNSIMFDFDRVGEVERPEVYILDTRSSTEKAIMIAPKLSPEERKELAAMMASRVSPGEGSPPQIILHAELPDSLKIGDRKTFMRAPNSPDAAVDIPTTSTDASIEIDERNVERLEITRLEGEVLVFRFHPPEGLPYYDIAVFPTDSATGEMMVLGPERDEQGRDWFSEKISQGLQELGIAIAADNLLYRAVPPDLQLSLRSSFQIGLEQETFGTKRSKWDNIVPQLIDFERSGDKIEMAFTYNGEDHFVRGTIDQTATKRFKVDLTGPNSDKAGLEQMQDAIKKILQVKMPELGYPEVQYRGEGSEVLLSPTLKKFTEHSGGELFSLTFAIGDHQEFDVRIYRSSAFDRGIDQEIPSIFVRGPLHGSISDEWMMKRAAQELTNQRPDLHYNGVELLPFE